MPFDDHNIATFVKELIIEPFFGAAGLKVLSLNIKANNLKRCSRFKTSEAHTMQIRNEISEHTVKILQICCEIEDFTPPRISACR
jgi:hypothetical protein